VTSHQQETVSKNDSRFNHANKQFFAQTAARRPMVGGGGGGVRNSAARRHRRRAAWTSNLRYGIWNFFKAVDGHKRIAVLKPA
jgi:hypothetical protein